MTLLKENLLAEFDALKDDLARVESLLVERLAPVAATPGSSVQAITSRVKARASLQRKLARPDRTYARLEEVTDLVGLRVVAAFEDALESIAAFVEGTFVVDLARSADKARALHSTQFGYRSLHYVCVIPDGILSKVDAERAERADRADGRGGPDARLPRELRFEIQIRTILQHAWAEIEHDLGYKGADAVPEPVRRRFSRLAGLMEIADAEFVAIRRDLADYRDAIARAVVRDAADAPLDEVTLGCFLVGEEMARADAACAREAGLPLTGDVFYPDYLARMLRTAGFDSVRGIRRALEEKAPALPKLVPLYFRFTRAAWGFGPESLGGFPRGYASVFLSHLALLESTPLELGRLERVTAFYAALDHPFDERAARRVARCFVETARAWGPAPQSAETRQFP